jgi:hypothetical protein
MTAIAHTDIAVTKIDEDQFTIANKMVINDLALSSSALTYPSGGIPIGTTPTKFGFHKTMKYANIMDAPADGLIYKLTLSDSAPKIRIWETAAGTSHTHSLTVYGGVAASAISASMVGVSGTTKLGKTASTDRTITTGTNSTMATTGLTEYTTGVAVPAFTLRTLFIGE